MAIDFVLTPDIPTLITAPENATVNSAGQVVMDLSTVGGAVGADITLSNVTPVATARANLGATTVGDAVFVAASAPAAVTAIGGTVAGAALFTAASAGAQLTALGATAAGTTVLTAATPAAQVTALGGTAAGAALFTSASAAAQRASLGATAAGSAIFTAATAAAQVTALGGTAAGSALLTAASVAAQLTALGVSPTTAVDLKADIRLVSTRECNLIDTATGSTYSFIPLFDGALTQVAFILDGATTAGGAASVAITIGGAAVVLGAALSAPIGSAAGFNVRTAVSSGGTFTSTQIITITTTSANTAATFGTVSLAGTRA